MSTSGETDGGRRRIAVVGLGFLGRGIAACVLGHGHEVVGFAPQEEELEDARRFIEKAIDELVDRAGLDGSLREDWPRRFVATTGYDDVAGCEFAIESVVEDFDVKQSVFDRLEDVLGTDTPIASNTSAIPITALQRPRRHAGRFLGMHWAEPAHATRFMELIRGERTTDAAFDAAARLARSVGKEPCLVQKDVPGFIVNRLGYAMYREALELLERGVADAETIDRAFRNACGLWASVCGPFRWIDITGGPALYASAMEGVLPDLSRATELPRTIRELRDAGARGTVNGQGFFEYTPAEAERWQRIYHDHVWRVRETHQRYFPH